MDPIEHACSFFPEDIAQVVFQTNETVTEVRLRGGCQAQIVTTVGDHFVGETLSAVQIRKIALSMMEHSYYAREEELKQGFFTLASGCRVGVCGSYAASGSVDYVLRTIGSLCVRIAREARGCASELLSEILADGRPISTLIASRPGLGKTTMLRDTVRQLSEQGWNVGLADERHEIAACVEGIPTLDVGPRTDVADGCPKRFGVEILLRTMSPQVIALDEIGNALDVEMLSQVSQRGVAILTTVHAGSWEELNGGVVGKMLRTGLFGRVIQLEGAPGTIHSIRRRTVCEDGRMVWSSG